MPFQIEQVNQDKLDSLKRVGHGSIQVGELVVVFWPSGARAYAHLKYDELPEYKDLLQNEDYLALGAPPVEARFGANVFQRVQRASSAADSKATFDFIDDDGEIARLCELHQEGVKLELFFYFPQVDLLVSRWWGHMGPPRETGGMTTPVEAAFGFRSSQSSCPRRARGSSCGFPFPPAAGLNTPEAIAENPCRYDRHIGGGHGQLDPATGEAYTSCPKNLPACLARIGDSYEYGGGDTAADTLIVNETKGPDVLAKTKGNESNLNTARRVIFGEVTVHNLECLASAVEPDTKHPDKGSARVLIDGCEGTILSMDKCVILNITVGPQHLNVRLGEYRQRRTAFSPNVNNYNHTALFEGVIQGDFRSYSGSQFTGTAHFKGLRDIRVYSAPNVFIKQWTDRNAWCILRILTDKVWGDGQDYARFVIQDWIDADEWLTALAGFVDAEGGHFTSRRASFNTILEERTTQQQIGDACLYSELSLPFPFQGKTRILPLKKEEDLESVPVFTDDLDLLMHDPTVRPILFNSEGSTLRTRKVKPDGELTNEILLNFLDAAHNNISRPLRFEDERAQWAAGRAFGDESRRVVKDEKTAFGVTDFGQAVRLGNRLRDLGEFDSGGLLNNREATFDASFLDTLDLHPYKVIKVISKSLERYKQPFPAGSDKHFQYFRVQDMGDESDLTVKMRVVAYPEDYYEQIEDEDVPPSQAGGVLGPNPGGGRLDRPSEVRFKSLTHDDDKIYFELEVV